MTNWYVQIFAPLELIALPETQSLGSVEYLLVGGGGDRTLLYIKGNVEVLVAIGRALSEYKIPHSIYYT